VFWPKTNFSPYLTKAVIIPPPVAGSKAKYNEQCILWVGPSMVKKRIKPTEPLRCDFIEVNDRQKKLNHEQDGKIPYPFKNQINNWVESDEAQ